MSILTKLKQRKLVRWALAYLAVAWLILQVLDIAADPFRLPERLTRAAFILLAFGLAVTLVLAWHHGEKGRQRVSATEVLLVGALVALGAVATVLVGGGAPAGAGTGNGDAALDHVSSGAPPGSVAVLPFASTSPNPDDEYFSDGLTEELIGALARVPGFRVMGRTSAFALKDRGLDVRTIGDTLHVAAVLEGSVRKEQDSIRITARLIDVQDGFPLWSGSYDRRIESVFAVQEEIARAIAKQLEVALEPETSRRLEIAGTESSEAYQHYLKGRYHLARRTPTEYRRAAEEFRSAIAADPRYAPAHAGLASAYSLLSYFGGVAPGDADSIMRSQVAEAIRLDPDNAEALVVRGTVRLLRDYDWQGAAADLEAALRLSPSDQLGHQQYALYLSIVGRGDEAILAADQARTLDPLSLTAMNTRGWVLVAVGRLDEAAEQASEMLEMAPELPAGHYLSGAVSLERDEPDAAVVSLERAVEGDPSPPILADLGTAYARAGREAEAREVLNRLEKRRSSGDGYVSPVQVARVLAALGEREQAIDWLQVGYDERDSWLVWIKHAYPRFASLRDEPRFQALLDRLHLPDTPGQR